MSQTQTQQFSVGSITQIRNGVAKQLTLHDVTFLKPERGWETSTGADAFLAISKKGKKRKTGSYNFRLAILFKKHKIGWKYISIGTHPSGKLFIAEGNPQFDFKVGLGFEVSNKTMLENLFNFFNQRIPQNFGEAVKIELRAEKFEHGFILTKI